MVDAYDPKRQGPTPEFERQWLAKFKNCIGKVAGETVSNEVLVGSEELPGLSGKEVNDWTRKAMDRLEALVDEESLFEIMTGCACQYPRTGLKQFREKYAETGDLKLVHGMLQEQFIASSREFLKLNDEEVENIEKWGWGVAGVLQGDRIIATKMPFEFHEYFKAENQNEKRFRFCHCPRIRKTIKDGAEPISESYCYCGAGFYKGIWEYILDEPVNVEVLETVLNGGDVCRIAVHLPTGISA